MFYLSAERSTWHLTPIPGLISIVRYDECASVVSKPPADHSSGCGGICVAKRWQMCVSWAIVKKGLRLIVPSGGREIYPYLAFISNRWRAHICEGGRESRAPSQPLSHSRFRPVSIWQLCSGTAIDKAGYLIPVMADGLCLVCILNEKDSLTNSTARIHCVLKLPRFIYLKCFLVFWTSKEHGLNSTIAAK